MTARHTAIACAAGGAAAIAARAGLRRALLATLRRQVDVLNRGDYRALLSAFADDAVLVFPDGQHRWAGEHRGRAAIEEFLRHFAANGLRGEVHDLVIGGWPWRMTAVFGFDDHADDPDGTRVYENRAVLFVTTRWGKVVRQEDFFADTGRIEEFERHLARREAAAR